MVTLGVEGRRKSKYVRWAKFDAKSAGLAALNFDLDGTFWWHETLKRDSFCRARVHGEGRRHTWST
jgi:hypothetical protein